MYLSTHRVQQNTRINGISDLLSCLAFALECCFDECPFNMCLRKLGVVGRSGLTSSLPFFGLIFFDPHSAIKRKEKRKEKKEIEISPSGEQMYL